MFVGDLASSLFFPLRCTVAVPGREARLAAAGAGLIALRLVEERQWLPLALVAALSLAYGILRPSFRAAVAFVAGALSLVGAMIAITDARWNGFAADQLPAFALAAGGITLLVAAV